jgi:hypothetical protein
MKKFLLFGMGAIVLIPVMLISYVKFALPNLGPAPDISIELTPERITRGAYLGQICMDCHSQRDYETFAGPIVPGTHGMGGELFSPEILDEIPGNIYVPNITPFALSDWTDGEIYRAITMGVSKDGKPLFPLMPWESFGKMDDEDIYSIIAYLRTLKPIPNEIPERELIFPVNILVHTLPHKQENKLSRNNTDIIKHGEYMFTAMGCGDCHTPISKGEPIPGMTLAGGMGFNLPTGGTVFTANITPEIETGIGRMTADMFVDLFKKYEDSTFVPSKIKKGDYNTLMPWLIYSKLEEHDLRAIYAYIRTVEPVKNPVVKFDPGS